MKDAIEFNLTETLAQCDLAIQEALTRAENSATVTKKENPGTQTQGLDVEGRCNTHQLDDMIVSSIPQLLDTSSDKNVVGESEYMYDSGYVKIPRSLLFDPVFRGMPLVYQMLFIHLVAHCVYEPTKYNDYGEIIDLEAGQVVVTWDGLVADFKGEISRYQINRAFKSFFKFNFSHHKAHHKRTVVTITHPETLALIKNNTAPKTAPRAHQERTNHKRISKEVDKSKKKKKKEKAADAAVCVSFGEIVSMTQEEFDKLKALMGEETLLDLIDDMNIYCVSTGKVYPNHPATLRAWHKKNQKKAKEGAPTQRAAKLQIEGESTQKAYSRPKL